jgi:hypothetical protein
VQIKVLRAFWHGGKRYDPGLIMALDDAVASGLITTCKAERVGAAAPAPSGPLTTESAPGIVRGKARAGGKDADQ